MTSLPPVTPIQALRSFSEEFIDTTIESKTRDWEDLREEFDKEQGDRWYQWWGRKEWREWLEYVLQKCTVADSGLHGCVIYSATGDTSFRYQTGYGKWMYRQEKSRPKHWDSTKVPLPSGKDSEQVHRLFSYLCTNDMDLRYAIGHPQKPVRTEEKWKDKSPLILVHLCNNGDQGCVNPLHILLSDALENASRNGCKHGTRLLCPHAPKCIHVDKKSGTIIPWRNVDESSIMQLTHSQLLTLSHAQWLAEHRNCRLVEEPARSVLDSPVKKQKRYRGSQSEYMKNFRAKKKQQRDEEKEEKDEIDLLDDEEEEKE